MSLISGSDDNKDDENHQIQSVGTKSISSNDDEAFFNNISTSFQRQSYQTQTEYQFINRNPLPNVTIYPTNIHFSTTYPNKSLTSKIIISNGGSQAEDFNITLKGDPEFSVSTQKVSLSPGETQSLIINFNPKKVSLFNSSLIFEGRTSIVAPITGHCIPSPLEYPIINSPSWIFPKKKTDKLISFSNNSLSESLSVVVSTNCMAFRATPQNFDIPPSSSCDVNLSFDPNQQLVENPSISIQCSQSGDSVTIPFVIAPKKEKIIVDFGAISVGRTTKQTLKLKYPQAAPIVQWPFSLENISDNGMPQDTMIFTFTAREIGDFRTKLHLTNFELELRASSVDPPYRIKIPPSFPLRPIKIQNMSESMLNLAFSLNTSSYNIDPETSDLRPNQVSELNIMSTNSNSSFPDNILMKVIWSTDNGKRIIDEYQLPVNLNQSSSVVDIENSDNSNYSFSQRRASSKCKTEVNPNEIELNTNYSNFNSEYTTNSKYNNQIQERRRKSNNSQALSNSSKSDSISQSKNRDFIDQDEIDYYSSPSKFENQNQAKSKSSLNTASNSQPKRNHIEVLDSFDYYEEEEDIRDINSQHNEIASNSRKTNRSYEMQNNKYSISLNSYEENKQNNSFNNYYDDYENNNALSDEYPNSNSYDNIDNNNRSKTNRENKNQQISFRHSSRQNNQHHHHHSHHRHHRTNNLTRTKRRRNEVERKHRHNRNIRRNNDFEYDYEINYYEDDYYEDNSNNVRKNNQKSKRTKVHQEKYYNDSASSQYENNHHNSQKPFSKTNKNSTIKIEEEEEAIIYSSDEERLENQKKKTKNQSSILETSDYSSEDATTTTKSQNKKEDSNTKKSSTTNANGPSSSISRVDDLRTQMTQTNSIGNGLQNLGSQTLDSFDEELESQSANTSKIQSSKSRVSQSTSTSTIVTSTITTDNEESMNQNRSENENQKKNIKNMNQNSKSVSFASQLAQLSQQQQQQSLNRSVTPTSSSFSFVPLFGVSVRRPSRFELTINSDFEIEIEAPKWIQLPKSIQSNQSFSIIANSLPSDTVLSTFSVHSESGDLSLPIIAYKGFSNLVFESEIEMIEITETQYTAAMTVKNNGERSGFIAFMLSESSNVNLRVSPPVAIIQPKANLQVKFLVTTKSGEFTIPVIAYYGDEIVRQLQSVVAPNDYLSTAFNEIEFSNEISAFESIINDCKPRDILKIFRKSSQTTKLVFKSPQKSFGLNRVTISPSSLEFVNENEEGKVSLLNLSPDPLSFSVSASDDSVTFSPSNGAAPPYGEAVITASLTDLVDSSIIIHVGKEKFNVPLRILNSKGGRNNNNRKNLNGVVPNTNSIFTYNETSFSENYQEKRSSRLTSSINNNSVTASYQKNSGAFSVDDDKIEFDFVNVGSSKTIQFVIVNEEVYDMNLKLKTDNQAFICDRKITLKGNSETQVDVTFKPKNVGVFDGNLLIKNEDHRVKIQLSGECANDSSSASSFITHPLVFPACIPDTIRRAQLRVSNKTDRFVSVTARTKKPFHCPFPFFEVDPFSYVLVPVRFIPKEAGEYNGTIEFHSSNGSVTTIELSGICVEV